MKIIKLKDDHYIQVDDSEIKEGDWMIRNGEQPTLVTPNFWWDFGVPYKKITHSTQPLGVKPITDKVVIQEDKAGKPLMSAQYVELDMSSTVKPLSLQEVKELIGEVDVMTKAVRDIEGTSWDEDAKPSFLSGYLRGYRQALEDNKEKKYTYYDIENAFNSGRGYGVPDNIKDFSSFIQSLQPKTEWEVEIVDGKLKLK